MNKMAKEQKVKDDEIENVGIMQGFMDDIEELMEEIAEAEMSGGEDQDMAKLMDRRPDSPEVLMNNLRGDYRSIDARREELADLVGMSAAVETPDDVLALLQPVLAQQGIEALTPSSSLPFGTMAPAAAMPPPPMEMAAAGLPAPPVEPGGVGSLPMGMAEGGIVQNFQQGSVEPQGSDPGGVTPAVSPADEYIARILAKQPSTVPDLMTRTQELTPQYADILGTADKDAIRAQMLFDIGQAALGFAGNVGPQGQALRGSMAARLAQATSALPGQIGARTAELRKGEQAARLAALQGAQAERDAAIAANLALAERQQDVAMEMAGRETFVTLGADEKAAIAESNPAFDASLPWQRNSLTGELVIAGGRPSSALVNIGGGKLGDVLSTNAANQLDASYTQANAALSTLNTVNEVKPLLEEGDLFSGPLSGAEAFVARLGTKLGVAGESTQETLNNTVAAMRSIANFELQAAAAMRGQGQITENERALIRRTAAGELTNLTAQEVKTLVDALEKTANYRIDQHNAILTNFKDVLKDEPDQVRLLNLYQLTETPIFGPRPLDEVIAAGSAVLDGSGG